MSESNIKKLTVLGMYTAIALSLHMAEAALPPLAPVPGIKPGLANIITLLLIVRFSSSDAFLVLTVRIIIASVFGGQAVSFIYSACGGVMCLIVMSAANRLLNGKYIYLTSILGSIAHNTGQILAAFYILGLSGIFAYTPYLIISGIIMGLFTGLICHFTVKKLPKNNY